MTVSFQTNYLNPMWQGTKRFAKNYVNFVLGVEQSEVFSKKLTEAVRGKKTFVMENGKKVKKYQGGKGYKELDKSINDAWKASKRKIAGKPFKKVVGDSFRNIPKEYDAVKRLAKITGKSSKKWLGILKIAGRRMPLAFNILAIGFELPNIFKAFKEGGIGTGLKETGKAAATLGAYAAGAAIGQALIPIPLVGGLIGGIVGGWLAGKVLGKSYTEKKEEAEAKAKEVNAASGADAQPPAINGNASENQAATQDNTKVKNSQGATQDLLNMAGVAPSGQTAGFEGQYQQQYNPNMYSQYSVNPYAANPFNQAQYQMGKKPFSQQDYMNQDFMAMGAGLA